MLVQVTWVGEGGDFTGAVYWPTESIQPRAFTGEVYGARVLFELQGTKYSGELSAAGISGKWQRGPQSQEFSLATAGDARNVVTANSRWAGRMMMPAGKPPEDLTITLGAVTPGGQVESGTVKRSGDQREGDCEGVILGDCVLLNGGRNLILYGTVEGELIRGEWRQGQQAGTFEVRRE